MRSTFKLLLYINRGKVRADGTTAVMCRISIDGKTATLTTGIYCPPSDWNPKKGEIRDERENNRLTSFRERVNETYDKILKQHGVVSAELLKNTITMPSRLRCWRRARPKGSGCGSGPWR